VRPEASARICEKLSVCTYENLGGGGGPWSAGKWHDIPFFFFEVVKGLAGLILVKSKGLGKIKMGGGGGAFVRSAMARHSLLCL